MCNRRAFLRLSATAAAGAPWALANGLDRAPGLDRSAAKVAIVACRSYGSEVKAALRRSLDLLGGIGSLVRNKTVTVKLNLTGTNFTSLFGRPVGESYMTHPATVTALTALLFDAGASRVRLVESTNSHAPLESTLALADWDVRALAALGRVEFENTRNLGLGKRYAHLKVPAGGYVFSSFDLNHSYADTDVLVSLAKLKQHVTAGVTLAMKNLFGITPNALYGDQAGTEDATAGRGPLHDPREFQHVKLPGLRTDATSSDPFYRVPHIVADLCAARPIDLAIIDGITSMKGGEGPWCGEVKPIAPGVLIAGLNPVSTDAVATAVMGFANPRATRGRSPFEHGDNHLLLAEQAGVGSAELARIDVRGLALDQARCPYT
ncbi:MAG: DUF362 domain-containing protein [Verrucomicrobia bacterium]|nr:DUF362 domain-containing protein [Verrucomicrobiota bacterium]